MAFQDVELSTEREPVDDNESSRRCDATQQEFYCVGKELRRCENNRWVEFATCAADQVCLDDLGKCGLCEPGVTHQCDGALLRVCNESGSGFEPKKDCAQEPVKKECNTSVVTDDCIECNPTTLRCDDTDPTKLHRCSPRGEFSSVLSCPLIGELGCIPVDGKTDYCAECDGDTDKRICDSEGNVVNCTPEFRNQVTQCSGLCNSGQDGQAFCEP